MNQPSFNTIIENSPALSATVKAVILENATTLTEESKQMVIETLIDFESRVLVGAEGFLSYLETGKDE